MSSLHLSFSCPSCSMSSLHLSFSCCNSCISFINSSLNHSSSQFCPLFSSFFSSLLLFFQLSFFPLGSYQHVDPLFMVLALELVLELAPQLVFPQVFHQSFPL